MTLHFSHFSLRKTFFCNFNGRNDIHRVSPFSLFPFLFPFFPFFPSFFPNRKIQIMRPAVGYGFHPVSDSQVRKPTCAPVDGAQVESQSMVTPVEIRRSGHGLGGGNTGLRLSWRS